MDPQHHGVASDSSAAAAPFGGGGSGGVTIGARAHELKDQLYNPDAKLTDLFGELEPKLMLDAIKKTYNPKNRRVRLPWYFTAGSDTEPRKSFVRDPCNQGRKLAVVHFLKRSVEEKGVVEDARGRMWVIEREDEESPYQCLSWGHLTEAVYLADKHMKETGCHNAVLSKSISQGVEAEIFEPMPVEAREFLVKFHNGVDERRDLMNQLKLVKKAEAAWRHHRYGLGATGRACAGSYEQEYWKFITNRFVGVWRSFRAFDSCKIVANQLSSLNLLDLVIEHLNDGCDVLRSGFTVETSFNAMQTILSLLGPVSQTYGQCDQKKRMLLEVLTFEALKFCVPWVDEAPSPVEWIFDRPRPDVAARIVANLAKSAIVTESDSKKRPSNGKVPTAKRQRTGGPATFDPLKMVSDDVTTAMVPGTNRPMTFADMLLQSALNVIATVDSEFSNAASTNMTQLLIRKTAGPYFSQMLHFAFVGKKVAPGGGKALTSLSKVKFPAMAELLESLIKACLPHFGSVSSNESLVEKLQEFLSRAQPSGASPSGAQSASTGSTASSSQPQADEAKFKALVFFATEGLGVQRLAEGDSNNQFGQKLCDRMVELGLLSKKKTEMQLQDGSESDATLRKAPLLGRMLLALKAGCSCSSNMTDEDSQCAYHSADASLEDMTYDVGRVLFAEYPPMVQDYVSTITDKFKTTWQLPPLITSVGLTEDVVLKLRCIRAACVLEMFDFLAHSPGSGSGQAAFENHQLAAIVQLLRSRKKLERNLVDLDNAMVDRHHFIAGWNEIFAACNDIMPNVKSLGSFSTITSDRLDKMEKDFEKLLSRVTAKLSGAASTAAAPTQKSTNTPVEPADLKLESGEAAGAASVIRPVSYISLMDHKSTTASVVQVAHEKLYLQQKLIEIAQIKDSTSWEQLQVMFDVSNTKNTLYGIKLPIERKDLVSAEDLASLGKTCNVAVLESAGFFQGVAESPQTPKTMFAQVNLNDFKDFRLTFFGPVALEGKSSFVPLTSMRQDDDNAPSLPWLVFGNGYDNVMTCECVCPAWAIPPKKIKQTPAQHDKEIAQNAKQMAKAVKTAEPKKNPKGSSGKENQNPCPDPNADAEEDDLAAFVSEAMGTKRKGQGRGRGSKQLSKTAAAKPKCKAKGKSKKGQEDFPIAFVDEPLLAFSGSEKMKVELPACGDDTARTVCINVPKLAFNPRLPLKTDDWEVFAHLKHELIHPGSELPTVIHVPVREIDSSFYLPITRGLLPAELLKLQEKSDLETDGDAIAKHIEIQETWGKQTVWTGLSDVVATHVGDTFSHHRGGCDKMARELRHLLG